MPIVVGRPRKELEAAMDEYKAAYLAAVAAEAVEWRGSFRPLRVAAMRAKQAYGDMWERLFGEQRPSEDDITSREIP